jgi:hypothetical protein
MHLAYSFGWINAMALYIVVRHAKTPLNIKMM